MKLAYTVLAYPFFVKKHIIRGVSAENAAGLIFFKHNFISVNKDFKSILRINVELITDFHRKNDSSKLIKFSCNTG